ncbi:hypothetical protein ACFLV0_04985 [Chloroflexota bacterium]
MVRSEKEYTLEEWKVAMDNARHFNDLLIRFRMLGLPMVITLSVAGIAAARLVDNIELWKWAIPLLSTAFSLLGIASITWHTTSKLKMQRKQRIQKKKHEESQNSPLLFSVFELLSWIIFVSVITSYSVISLTTLVKSGESISFLNVSNVSLTPLAIIAAVVLLVSLYSMDRFYYYELLIGAVSRLIALESSLKYNITETTSRFIPREHATNLITFFYGLPGITLLTAFCLSGK